MNSGLNDTLCPFHPVFRKGQIIKDNVSRKPFENSKELHKYGHYCYAYENISYKLAVTIS